MPAPIPRTPARAAPGAGGYPPATAPRPPPRARSLGYHPGPLGGVVGSVREHGIHELAPERDLDHVPVVTRVVGVAAERVRPPRRLGMAERRVGMAEPELGRGTPEQS